MRQMAAGKLDVFSLATEVEQFGSNPRRRVSMGLTFSRKQLKKLAVRRKNWQILTIRLLKKLNLKK